MLHIFRKKPQGQEITFKIQGMHCTSCVMNIDGALEETQGVISSTTSYLKAKVKIEYDQKKVAPEKLKKVIEDQGYTVRDD